MKPGCFQNGKGAIYNENKLTRYYRCACQKAKQRI